MIAELGQFALILALLLATLQAVFPLIGAHNGERTWMALARPAAVGQFLMMLAAFACLTAAFVQNDFSVRYVASNSNSQLPLYFRIAAVWGAHEGSMLLWSLILAVWTLAVALASRNLDRAFVARVLGVLGLIAVGVYTFILFTSNPFERVIPAPADGRDLNPLLQDIGLTIHPPLLYLGYVGMSVAFSFAMAALLSGRLDSAWARWSRPWTLCAWGFLTIGIVLGSGWAYYELGWGGWWFWDPVENASFMPWLVGTALIHSLVVTEKRGAFKAWTVLLALFGFALSLVGTFLVRSGVLTSVHAFATDPTRGTFILIFLAIVVGGSLLLYAIRAPAIRDDVSYAPVSKENLLLINNILLVTAAASVLLGTLYPLVLDALGLGKISVGPPYFNSVFVPLMIPVLLLAGCAPMVPWRGAPLRGLVWRFRWLAPVCLLLGVGLATLWFGTRKLQIMGGLALALWLASTALMTLFERVRLRQHWFDGLRAQSASVYGMTLAHFGLAIFLIGAMLSGQFSSERLVLLKAGETVELAGYQFKFQGVFKRSGPNYVAAEGDLQVTRGGRLITELHPQKRHYPVQRNTMTEAAIDGNAWRDLYVALGEQVDDRWSMRVYHKPFIRWIWGGGAMMMLGGFVCASDRRYRSATTARRTIPAAVSTVQGS